MEIGQALQFWTPLVGLLVMAFWLGVLSNRVSTLEREERDRKTRDGAESAERERIVRVETKLDGAITTLASVQREIAGMQRSLGNLSTGRGNRAVQLVDEP